MNNIAIAFLIGQALFLAVFMLFSFINYKARVRVNYDLRNHFPYELNFDSNFKENLLGNISVIIMMLSGIFFYIFFDNTHVNGYYVFIMICGSINVVLITSLIFIPLKTLKTHLILIATVIVFSFLIPFGVALSASIDYMNTKSGSSLVMVILGAIFCLFIFIMIMNPKLNKWAKLEEVKSPDGAISYIRPKYFVLAFTEWLLIFFSLLTEILVLIEYSLIH